MLDELSDALNTWTAKMPIISNNKEIKIAKQMQQTIQGIVNVVGRDATLDTLQSMSRTEKLKAAIQGTTTVDAINTFVQQFNSMDIMHKVLRQRQSAGKPLPATAEAMQIMIQQYGPTVLSKSQKSKLVQQQKKKMNVPKSLKRR
jgi:hypothetical protein